MRLNEHISMENDVRRDDDVSALVRLRCAHAKEQSEAGEFEAALASMSELWEGVGARPRLEGLDAASRAEVLLRVGSLSSCLGSAQQISGSQEIAKDLITESAGIFEKLGLVERVVEARTDLAICYWREGAVDEARITLDDALTRLGDLESEQRLRILLDQAIVEQSSDRPKNALRLLKESAPVFEESHNHALRGKFHNEFATVLKNVGLAERREEYLDRALIEYAAAGFHLEEAGHKRYQVVVENNLGFLFVHLEKFEEAHQHLARARSAAAALKDKCIVAQIDDTRARALLGQQKYREAETVAFEAVRLLEVGGQHSLLSEVLTTHATALARLRDTERALAAVTRAIRVAEQAGDSEHEGMAALTVIEELDTDMSTTSLLEYYNKAESKLALSQHAGIRLRLGECARKILAAERRQESLSPSSEENGSKGNQVGGGDGQGPFAGSLERAVLRYEGNLIRSALEASAGSVTRAARLLGLTHQGLAFILNGRHKNLLDARTPVKTRRRSIIRYR